MFVAQGFMETIEAVSAESGFSVDALVGALRVATRMRHRYELSIDLLGEAARIAVARNPDGRRSAIDLAFVLQDLCLASERIMGPSDPLRRIVNQDPGELRRH